MGIWKNLNTKKDAVCHRITGKKLQCKFGDAPAQTITVHGYNFTWSIQSHIYMGSYVGKDLIDFDGALWRKQGKPSSNEYL